MRFSQVSGNCNPLTCNVTRYPNARWVAGFESLPGGTVGTGMQTTSKNRHPIAYIVYAPNPIVASIPPPPSSTSPLPPHSAHIPLSVRGLNFLPLPTLPLLPSQPAHSPPPSPFLPSSPLHPYWPSLRPTSPDFSFFPSCGPVARQRGVGRCVPRHVFVLRHSRHRRMPRLVAANSETTGPSSSISVANWLAGRLWLPWRPVTPSCSRNLTGQARTGKVGQ